MPEILIEKNLALESLIRAPLSPDSKMIAKLAIDSVPVVDAEPVRHGRWIVRGQEIYCSECNEESLYNPFGASKFSRFCPNCGADMQEVSEDAND